MYVPVEESAFSWSMRGSRKVLIVGFERPNHNPASSKFLRINLINIAYAAECLHTLELELGSKINCTVSYIHTELLEAIRLSLTRLARDPLKTTEISSLHLC